LGIKKILGPRPLGGGGARPGSASVYNVRRFVSVYNVRRFASVYNVRRFASVYNVRRFASVYNVRRFASVYNVRRKPILCESDSWLYVIEPLRISSIRSMMKWFRSVRAASHVLLGCQNCLQW